MDSEPVYPNRIIVAGSREYTDYEFISRMMDKLVINLDPKTIQIVSGGARGPDQLGGRYAEERGYALHKMPADWETFGKRAGFMRNEEMARYASHCVCFHASRSSGTASMIKLAKAYNLKLRIFEVLSDAERLQRNFYTKS